MGTPTANTQASAPPIPPPFTTLQEAFNRVWQAFAIEGQPRSTHREYCHYYHPEDGRGCAIGVLLPPDTRRALQKSGGAGWKEILYRKKRRELPTSLTRDPDFRALLKLSKPALCAPQHTHDKRYADALPGYNRMESDLRTFAAEYGVKVPADPGDRAIA